MGDTQRNKDGDGKFEVDEDWLTRKSDDDIRELIALLTTYLETREALNAARRAEQAAMEAVEATGIPKSVFSFQVLDPDPEVLTYGCIAYTLDEAKELAAKAGHNELILLEQRELEAQETDDFARDQLLANPFLGAQWALWVEAFAPALEHLQVGQTWGLDVCPPPYVWGHGDIGDTVFVQGIAEADGSHHLEIGTADLIRQGDAEVLKMLELGGWTPPQNGIPIHHRLFEPGANSRYVLYVAFQALSVVHGITENDIFLPQGALRRAELSTDEFDSGKYDGPFELSNRAYALKGTSDLSDEKADEETTTRILQKRFGKSAD